MDSLKIKTIADISLSLISIFGLSITLERIIITQNLNAQIYFSSYWNAPIASEAAIGFAFIWILLAKYNDWKPALALFFLLDGLWELIFQIYWILNGFQTQFLGPLYFQAFIVLEIVLGTFILRKIKANWDKPYLLIGICDSIFLNWWFNNFKPIIPDTQQILEIVLCLILILTIKPPKPKPITILTSS